MLPPGQGVTVTVPGAAPQSPRFAAPPSPFRQSHGPDVVIMPHTDDQPAQAPTQPQQVQPQQMQRRSALQMARRALKLSMPGILDPGMMAHLSQSQHDEAPWRIFGDHLIDQGYGVLGQLLGSGQYGADAPTQNHLYHPQLLFPGSSQAWHYDPNVMSGIKFSILTPDKLGHAILQAHATSPVNAAIQRIHLPIEMVPHAAREIHSLLTHPGSHYSDMYGPYAFHDPQRHVNNYLAAVAPHIEKLNLPIKRPPAPEPMAFAKGVEGWDFHNPNNVTIGNISKPDSVSHLVGGNQMRSRDIPEIMPWMSGGDPGKIQVAADFMGERGHESLICFNIIK